MDNERTRSGRALEVAAAVLTGLLTFTAVPTVLVLVVGNPASGGLGHTWHPVPRDALCALTVAAWVAWVACCAQLVRAVVAHVRSGDVSARRDASVMDRIARRIAVGVIAFTTVGVPLAVPAVAGASASATSKFEAGAVPAARSPATAVHVVRPGESLWGIAELRLADGADWTAIAALNLWRDMGHGTRFVDPDDIRAGWHLRLPSTADERDAWRTSPSGPSRAGPTRSGERLPELVALGLGSLACAALARRARSRRRIDPYTGDLDLGRTLSDAATDAASLLHRFGEVPALRSFETANRLLGRSLHGDPTGPVVRTICVSPSGVTFWLTEPRADAADGFEPLWGGAAWHVDHAALGHEDASSPYVAIALPVGEDEDGTWLIALRPGDVLPLLGESAPELARSARSAAGAWAWSDMVLVTDDPDDPELGTLYPRGPVGARHGLFFGDPASLTAPAARSCAVVTTATVAATDLTVLVDRRGATLHPTGRVVRPHLQSVETSRRLRELTAAPGGRDPAADVLAVREPAPRTGDGTTTMAPGPVDVRLLTMTPRMDGLREDLPPNRARRAIELVAYLALHQPDGVTGDRLRTRVLGSSDADAASKTLFNTAHAARRAMGVDEHGSALFPAGTRNGLYQVSSHVTVDVHRAIALTQAGRSQLDPDRALAHYCAALDLVEGEPLANALSGYSWWEAEGHGGRIAAVLVDAACSMAALASDAGHFDLARWGLERARAVEPYSEALSRAAMQLAATEGDADRLRLEWRECQRRVDDLDPGSSPSSRTESLYGELSRRVLADDGDSGARRPRYAPVAGD